MAIKGIGKIVKKIRKVTDPTRSISAAADVIDGLPVHENKHNNPVHKLIEKSPVKVLQMDGAKEHSAKRQAFDAKRAANKARVKEQARQKHEMGKSQSMDM